MTGGPDKFIFTPDQCVMGKGIEPVIIADCVNCESYPVCKARKDAVDHARKLWFFHDGELHYEHRVEIAIIKLIERRGIMHATIDLADAFSISTGVIDTLLRFNDRAELTIDDFIGVKGRTTVNRHMVRLIEIGLVKRTGPEMWRINA